MPEGVLLAVADRGTALAVRGMLGAAGLPCKRGAYTDCCSRQPPGAGRGLAHGAFARGSTCACCTMPATPMAVARWLLPLPGPPTRTTLCAALREGRVGQPHEERGGQPGAAGVG